MRSRKNTIFVPILMGMFSLVPVFIAPQSIGIRPLFFLPSIFLAERYYGRGRIATLLVIILISVLNLVLPPVSAGATALEFLFFIASVGIFLIRERGAGCRVGAQGE